MATVTVAAGAGYSRLALGGSSAGGSVREFYPRKRVRALVIGENADAVDRRCLS